MHERDQPLVECFRADGGACTLLPCCRLRFILKAGRYNVECSKKGENAPAKQTEITVVAGEAQSAKIDE